MLGRTRLGRAGFGQVRWAGCDGTWQTSPDETRLDLVRFGEFRPGSARRGRYDKSRCVVIGLGRRDEAGFDMVVEAGCDEAGPGWTWQAGSGKVGRFGVRRDTAGEARHYASGRDTAWCD